MYVTLLRPSYHTHLVTPPLGLGYLAGALRAAGVFTSILDGLKYRWPLETLLRHADAGDLIGISCLSDYFPTVVALCRELKARGKTIVLGGPHISALPHEALLESGADFAVVGEGERSFVALVRYLEGASRGTLPPGVVGRGQAAFVPGVLEPDLDALPFPDWGQLDPRTYPRAPHGGLIRQFPVAPVISSRGCPYDCSFCASPTLWGKEIRFRTPSHVGEELSLLVKHYGVREIHFEDDNFTLRPDHAAGVCEEILRRELSISFALPNGIRVDAVTPDLLRLMRRAGCYYVAFGIESGHAGLLQTVHKHTTPEKIASAVHLAHQAGLTTQGFFIFGFPGETEATIEETIRFACSLPLDRAQFLLLDVLPGSALWPRLHKELREEPGLRSYQQVKWVPEGVDLETLEATPARAFRRFFLRPRPLWNLLKLVRPAQLPFVWQRLKDFGVMG